MLCASPFSLLLLYRLFKWPKYPIALQPDPVVPWSYRNVAHMVKTKASEGLLTSENSLTAVTSQKSLTYFMIYADT